MSTNHLDKTISSLLRASDDADFENLFGKAVNELHSGMDQIYHTIMMNKDAPIIINQFYHIILSSLSQSKDMLNRELNERQGMVLSKAIEAISIYFGIINSPDSIIVAFSTYLNISVCIIALHKILTDRDNVYQKYRTNLVKKCSKFTD